MISGQIFFGGKGMQKGMVSVVKACLIFIWCAILTGTNAMYSAYLLVGLLAAMCLIANGKKQPLRELLSRGTRAAAVACAVLLSVAVTAANYKFFTSVGALNAVGHLLRCLKAAGLLLGGYVVFGEIIAFLADRAADRGKNGAASVAPPCRRDLWVLFGSWAIIVAVNVTVLFLTQYPGVLTSDSTSQVRQTMIHTYSNHHPYYHTQIIHLLMNVGMALFGDINAAVATYTVFQIAAMGFIFAFAVFTLWQATRDRLFAMLAFLAYLLLPYHISYSFSVWKDVLFGGVVLLFALGSYRVLKNIGRHPVPNVVLTAVSALGVCLLRSNGMVAFTVALIAFAVLFFRRGKKAMTFVLLGTLAVSFVLKHPVLDALHVTQPDTVESLSIPVQQIARVVADGKPLTEEQKALLGQVIDLDAVPSAYDGWISDPIKNLVRDSGRQDLLHTRRGDLIRCYLQIGLRYPHKYLEAWIDQTLGYWNAGYHYWIWGKDVAENRLGIETSVASPRALTLFDRYRNAWSELPALQPFVCIGLHVWGIVLLALLALVRRDRAALFVTVPFLAVVLTLLIATPVYSEFRYAYAVFCGTPFLFAEAGHHLFGRMKNVPEGEG